MSMTRGKRMSFSRRVQDLNLRLEQQEPHKSTSVAIGSSRSSHTIIVDDDDDDVQVSSPRTFAQAKSSVLSSRQRNRTLVENRQVSDDPLELRLGPSVAQTSSLRCAIHHRQLRGSQERVDRAFSPPDQRATLTIDLTSPTPSNDDCIVINESRVVPRRKRPQPHVTHANELKASEPAKELRLTCAICMDTMKEETSTTCGHIFCRECILGAIAAQKKCPTCRHKLSNNLTHRIYISGSIRNS